MIRVLHFVSTPSIGSGVMSVIMNYYRHMDRSKIQFDFLCFIPCEDSYEKEINELGGRVFFVSKPGSSVKSIKELWRFFKSHRGEYQWLHNHEVYLSFFLSLLVNHFCIEKIIVHAHATEYSDKVLNGVRNRILCLPLKYVKTGKQHSIVKVACSRAAGIFLYGKDAVESGEVVILPNAIDVNGFRFDMEKRMQVRKDLQIEEDIVVGHIGRFAPQKNHEFLLDIFHEFVLQKPNAKLMLIGTGDLYSVIQKKAENELPHKSVLFMGECKNVNELLNAMDIFILPSLYEGFPVSAIEAQANGLPCVLASSITSEAQINEKVYYKPINSAVVWAENLSLIVGREEINMANWDKYDISFSSKCLERIYVSLSCLQDEI